MSRIKLLDDALINKIAAGEVIERPASVLKEVVENSIDAGATKLSIDLEEGGTKLIAVTDNGCGMAQEELSLAVTRHATSKIRTAEDLFQIGTLGFRGEALASIASVAKVTVASRQRGAASGHKLLAGPKPEHLAWSGAEGTMITVEKLFQAVPARQKFLRKPASEYSRCLEVIQAMALGHPEVAFRVSHNGKQVALYDAVTEPFNESHEITAKALKQRAAQVFPGKNCDQWLWVAGSDTYGAVYGIVSPPGMEEGTSRHLWTYANGRYVKDQTLRRGVLRGYHSHLLKGRYPACVLFFSCQSELLDVNVHPAKMELRFQYPGEVQNVLTRAIREGLRQGAWAHESMTPSPADASAELPPQVGLPPPPASRRSVATELSGSPLGSGSGRVPTYQRSGSDLPRKNPAMTPSFAAAPVPAGSPGNLFEAPQILPTDKAGAGDIDWQSLTYMGSFARCYLIFSGKERLLLVDQHAFHERILYEKLCADSTLLHQRQDLLVPESVVLEPAEINVLAENLSALAAIGIEIAVLSATEIEVKSVPTLLTGRDFDGLCRQLAVQLEAGEDLPKVSEISHDLLSTIACHSAVRSGEELPEVELNLLLRQAAEVDFYHNCPHGRRVLRWFSQAEVGRMFDR